MKLKLNHLLLLALIILVVACRKNDYNENDPLTVKEFNFPVCTCNQLHPVSSAPFSNFVKMKVLSDNSIDYEVYEDSAAKRGDIVTSVEVRLGDSSVANGPLIALLPGRFRAGWATGSGGSYRKSFINDTLLNSNVQKYLNVITQLEPLGLVRGQIR